MMSRGVSEQQAAVTLRRMGTYLEYGRVPPQLRAPLVHALLGTLHIRCADETIKFRECRTAHWVGWRSDVPAYS